MFNTDAKKTESAAALHYSGSVVKSLANVAA